MADKNNTRTVPTWIMGIEVEVPANAHPSDLRSAAMDVCLALQLILTPSTAGAAKVLEAQDLSAVHTLAVTARELMSAADELDEIKGDGA
jgi:hypothetical protein